MNISNLSELIHANILNEGSILSVAGFALNLNELKSEFAFFSNDEKEILQAIEKGAFAIISEYEFFIKDKEIYYLKVENLEISLMKLLRFLCEEKECKFLSLKSYELSLCKAFSLNVLKGNIFIDFDVLIKAKKGEIFCFNDENYLLKICANTEILKEVNFTLLSRSSFFFTTLVCDNLYFKNLNLPFVYAQVFAKIITYLKEKNIKINFDFNKIDDFKIYFIDEKFEICEFGTSVKAFIVVNNQNTFDYWNENFKHAKGFKTAVKNSLFCDFSYSKLSDLKNLKDFKYCLILENHEDFEQEFESKSNQLPSLF
ncbi:hypothetical protein ACD575_00185 [Campylobacter sp. LH-2024]|uniref:hypothetical protein n=1 Tax=Campylobacter TaxID=194 RepID=UPI001D8F2644|nr:hypothetical protein [Campylobacter sp. RM12910]MBZ7932198.1 hypothetical protein [Campylobacter sp. RM10543]MBZ7933710.1 hypothetical protein [Campylobacter sp. W0065]MBZ7950419.1 hypothetical protein [Campylobacter sp. W0046]MBZ7960584.1 hypothetical protein [Campylobacter sp. RM9930]MBZ7968051.1 hypothetical protein [Campylobacter sp. RM9759]